jgi:hypothetical protein
MLKVVTYDDGNASHPNHLVLVRADTDQKARELADSLVADWKDPDEEWFSVTVSENEHHLILPPGRNAEIL